MVPLYAARVQDLGPLQGMPLTVLHIRGCRLVRDLTPLEGMPLTDVQLGECVQVRDLKPTPGLWTPGGCATKDISGFRSLRIRCSWAWTDTARAANARARDPTSDGLIARRRLRCRQQPAPS